MKSLVYEIFFSPRGELVDMHPWGGGVRKDVLSSNLVVGTKTVDFFIGKSTFFISQTFKRIFIHFKM